MADPARIRIEAVSPGSDGFEEYVATFSAVFPDDAQDARAFLERYATYPNYLDSEDYVCPYFVKCVPQL